MKRILSWALYDWANSAFATTVMAGFFPMFFKQYWSVDVDSTGSTFKLGLANSLAGLFVAAAAPVLGAIADRGGVRKRFLVCFAIIGIVMTGSLYFVEKGQWVYAAALYAAAIVGFAGGNVFYDSLIVGVSTRENVNFVSGLGFSLGYLGGGLLFAINILMTLNPALFGVSDSLHAVRLSFLTVAVWWAVFTVPLVLFVNEPTNGNERTGWDCISEGLRELKNTFHEARRLKVVFLFLLGYWLYIDGVDTIVKMALDYGLSLGFNSQSLIVALLITQFVGFPAALFMGKAGDWIGTKNAIFLCLFVYVGVTAYSFFMSTVKEFYVLAVAIGLVQGGVQSLSRSLYTSLIPKNKSAEFFGLYNMMGKFATIVGPLMVGWVGVLTKNPRHGILSILVLFVGGGLLLYLADEKEGRRMAEKPGWHNHD